MCEKSAINFSGPLYDPPYDSPLEDLFALNIIKYLDCQTEFEKQVQVDTISGTFFIDFVISKGDRRIAIECDGKEFHGRERGLYDEFRSGLILGQGAVDGIYRLRGCDLMYHLSDCLFVLSQWEPSFFGSRGLLNLSVLASHVVKRDISTTFEIHPLSYTAYYLDESQSHMNPLHIYIERFMRENPKFVNGQHWQRLYRYAVEQNGGSINDLATRRRKQLHNHRYTI